MQARFAVGRRFRSVAGFLLAAIGLCAVSDDLWAQAPPRQIAGWGTVIDPDGDCRIDINNNKLTVTVPGKLHDLNPRNGRLNAPRVLRQVTGDFVVEVTVDGTFRPTAPSTAPRSVAFNGAGLLVWGNQADYVRLERNLYINAGQPTCYPPLFEVFKAGRYVGANPKPVRGDFFRGQPAHLRLTRKGQTLTAAYSRDGKEWTELKNVAGGLPETVSVGVSAINTSSAPLTVRYSNFRLQLSNK